MLSVVKNVLHEPQILKYGKHLQFTKCLNSLCSTLLYHTANIPMYILLFNPYSEFELDKVEELSFSDDSVLLLLLSSESELLSESPELSDPLELLEPSSSLLLFSVSSTFVDDVEVFVLQMKVSQFYKLKLK